MKRKNVLIIAAAAGVLMLLTLILFFARPQPPRVGICYSGTEGSIPYRSDLEQALRKDGYQLEICDADGDQARQLEQIQQLAQHDCIALLLEPVMLSAYPELKEAVSSCSIPTFLIGREPEEFSPVPEIPISYQGPDRQSIYAQYVQLLSQLPNGGDINTDGDISFAVVQGPVGYTDAQAFSLGLQEQLIQNKRNHHFLGTVEADCTMQQGAQSAQELFAAYGKDLEVVFCNDIQLTLGVNQAIADSGRELDRDIYLFSLGGDEDTLQALSQNKMTGTVLFQEEDMIQQVLTCMKRLSQNEPLPESGGVSATGMLRKLSNN